MKRKLLLGFLGLILLLFIVMSFMVYSYKTNRENYFQEFPELIVSDLFFRSVNLGEHTINTASVLIYFNSSCPICQSEAELIEKNFKKDTLTRFLWVSSESVEEIKEFSALYKLDSLSSHHFYSDTLYSLANAFKLTGVPATFVFDAEGNLVDYSLGAVSISDLKLSIQKAHDRSR